VRIKAQIDKNSKNAKKKERKREAHINSRPKSKIDLCQSDEDACVESRDHLLLDAIEVLAHGPNDLGVLRHYLDEI